MLDSRDFILAPLFTEDASAVHHLMVNDAERFRRYFPKTLDANLTEEKSGVFIKEMSEAIQNKKLYLFALKTENQIAGLIYIKELDWKKKQGEFAYCIGSQFSGKGWISKGINMLSGYAFTELGLETLVIITHTSNAASVRIAERNNFQFVKVLKNEYTPPGEKPMDMELYQLKK